MKVLVSIIVLAILSVTLLDVHSNTHSGVSPDYAFAEADVEQFAVAQENDANQHESKEILHKHCSVSCFVIPASYKFSHFSMKGNVTAYKVGYLEFLFVNRLKRPPRHSA